jgi:hypothetical protein
MRRLVKHQPVRVELDAKVDWEADCLECRVVAISGPVAALTPPPDLRDELRVRLATGAMCFLTFEHNRVTVALRGVALMPPDSTVLEFVVVDGIQVAERRSAERTGLVTPVKAALIGPDGGAGDPAPTVTSNLSMGGALLLRRPAMGDGPRWRIELFLPGDPEHIHCDAELARATATHFGVKFANLAETDQLRLAGLLAGLRRPAPALA